MYIINKGQLKKWERKEQKYILIFIYTIRFNKVDPNNWSKNWSNVSGTRKMLGYWNTGWNISLGYLEEMAGGREIFLSNFFEEIFFFWVIWLMFRH